MLEVLFTVDGENVLQHEVKVAGYKMRLLAKVPGPEVSVPIVPVKQSVTMAGDGFKILLIQTEILAIAVFVLTIFEMTTLLPETPQAGLN